MGEDLGDALPKIRVGADYQAAVSVWEGPCLSVVLEPKEPELVSVVGNDLTVESSGGNKPPCHGTWSDADKERFIEELLLRRKNLRGVARAVGRPVKEVVAFYYSPEFRAATSGKSYSEVVASRKRVCYRMRRAPVGYEDESESESEAKKGACFTCKGEGGQMAGCDGCDEWFCLGCAGAFVAEDLPSSWFCAACSSRGVIAAASGKDETVGDEEYEWTRCKECSKWRRLPAGISAAELHLGTKWVCSRNWWDEDKASCAAPQHPGSPEDQRRARRKQRRAPCQAGARKYHRQRAEPAVGGETRPAAKETLKDATKAHKKPVLRASGKPSTAPKADSKAKGKTAAAAGKLDFMVLWNGEWYPAARGAVVPSGHKFIHADNTMTIVPENEVEARVRPRTAVHERCEDQEAALAVGMRVEGRFLGLGIWYRGTVAKAHADGTVSLQYDDGDFESNVARDNVRPYFRRPPRPTTPVPAPAAAACGPRKGSSSSSSVGCSVVAKVGATASPGNVSRYQSPSASMLSSALPPKPTLPAVDAEILEPLEPAVVPVAASLSTSLATALVAAAPAAARPASLKRPVLAGFAQRAAKRQAFPEEPHSLSGDDSDGCNSPLSVLRVNSPAAGGLAVFLRLAPSCGAPSAHRPSVIALDATALQSCGGVVLGRSPELTAPHGAMLRPTDADVKAVDPFLNPAKVLSRRHTRLTATTLPSGIPALWAEDLGSTNGTYVDGAKLAAGAKVELRVGSSLALGLPWFLVAYNVEAAAAAGGDMACGPAVGARAAGAAPARQSYEVEKAAAAATTNKLARSGAMANSFDGCVAESEVPDGVDESAWLEATQRNFRPVS